MHLRLMILVRQNLDKLTGIRPDLPEKPLLRIVQDGQSRLRLTSGPRLFPASGNAPGCDHA